MGKYYSNYKASEEFEVLDGLIMTYGLELQIISENESEMQKTNDKETQESCADNIESHSEMRDDTLEEIKKELAKHNPEAVKQFLAERKSAWREIKENTTIDGNGVFVRDAEWQATATTNVEHVAERAAATDNAK